MLTGNVSFGKVIAVSGYPSRIASLNNKLKKPAQDGQLMMKDATLYYQSSPPINGSLAKAANAGQSVEIYITGNDIQKIKKREKGWDTIGGILSNMSEYINLNKSLFITPIAEKVLNSK